MTIPLYWHGREGINWNKLGEPATEVELEAAIDNCRGRLIPNETLPSLSPGDVVQLVEGVFWIDRDWIVQPCELHQSAKLDGEGVSTKGKTRLVPRAQTAKHPRRGK